MFELPLLGMGLFLPWTLPVSVVHKVHHGGVVGVTHHLERGMEKGRGVHVINATRGCSVGGQWEVDSGFD